MTAETNPSPWLDSPIDFALGLFSDMAAEDESRVLNPSSGRYRRFEAALDELRRRYPEEDKFGGLLQIVGEQARAWAGGAHADGIRFALAAEQFRLALLAAYDAADNGEG